MARDPEQKKAQDRARHHRNQGDPEYRAKKNAYSKAWQAANSERKRETNHAWKVANPERNIASSIASQKRHPERTKAVQRKSRFKRKYGLTLEGWNQMMIEQDGRCAICVTPFTADTRTIHVDHCHKTGRIRGLLCSRCNLVLGQVHDDEQVLLDAVEYLMATKGKP